MGLIILRCVFVMVSIGLAIIVINSGVIHETSEWMTWAVFLGLPGLSVGVILLDVFIRQKHLDIISAVYFGMIVGLFMAYVASLALAPLFSTDDPAPGAQQHLRAVQFNVQLVLGLVFCYICISLLIQTRHDFRFLIPFVEFAREVKGSKPLILDTSVVIDGRIADVLETGIFDGELIMPKFVIGELQGIADSSDRLRRSRGRRGLDILNRLRANADVDLTIFERDLPEFTGQPVDLKLVILAKHMEGKLVTNDYNLNKIARLQGVKVVNLNDVANALKPVFLPGEHIDVRIVKPGEEPGQGVGYLEDGTMVVVEAGRDHINEQVGIAVTSVLQTSAGRMVFGRYEETKS
ncbi:MAG: PIN/TRAM domain-containing protein [Pirellulales bacterium]|nr:PIN/TRAM domain-containing protein [Pirellulales bacterium]